MKLIYFVPLLALCGFHHAKAQPKLLPTKIGPAIEKQIESHLDLTFARIGDRSLRLHLYRPKNAGRPLPAIVCIHGGGWNKGDRRHHANIAKALAARGYVTVSIDYRLSGEAQFPAHLHDCKTAVRWLRAHAKKWGVNPKFIGATGASAGGHLAALLGTSGGVRKLQGSGGHADFSSRVQAVAPMAAQSDLMSERTRLVSTREIYRQFLGGTQEEATDTYRLASPRTHLDAGDPPMFFLAGEQDDPSTRADVMRRECLALGVPAKLFVVKGAPHPVLKAQKHFDIVVDQLDAFFRLHLERQDSRK